MSCPNQFAPAGCGRSSTYGWPDPSAGAAASAARIATTTCDQLVAELLFDVLGPVALDGGTSAPLHGAIEDHWRYAQAATVASGTIEVQRMLVARDVLGEHR
jgi:alkylation response protein AidB-like acyl-CoA dehydrogenase